MKKRLIFVMMLAVVLVFGMSSTAFAGNNLQAKKVVTTGANTAFVPSATFNFTVANGSAGKTISYAATGTEAAHNETTKAGITGGLAAGSAAITDTAREKTFSFTVDPSKFSSPGIYRYVVTETNGNVEGFSYDTTPRYVDVYIQNNSAGTALECAGYVVVKANDGYNVDDQNQVTETSTQKKEAGGDGGTGTPSGGVLTFSNVYAESDDPTPGVLHTLKITKAITGNQGDKNKDFSFSFTISGNVSGEKYTYKVFNANGSVKTTATATSGTAVTGLGLSDGMYIEVYGISSSDQYKVSENADGYTQTIKRDSTTVTATQANTNTAMGTADHTMTFTNNKSGTVPTGLFINHWPVFLIGLAVLGILALIMTRRRDSIFK